MQSQRSISYASHPSLEGLDGGALVSTSPATTLSEPCTLSDYRQPEPSRSRNPVDIVITSRRGALRFSDGPSARMSSQQRDEHFLRCVSRCYPGVFVKLYR
jgi:hypothetical protein